MPEQTEITTQETGVTLPEVKNFLETNANSIDERTREIVSRDMPFMQRYVTHRGLAKLSDEIKIKRITSVADLYSKMYEIQANARLKDASELVVERSQEFELELKQRFRSFADIKLAQLQRDSNKSREDIFQDYEISQRNSEKYKNLPTEIYLKYMESAKNQLEKSLKLIDDNMDNFTKIVNQKAESYKLEKL